MWLADFTCNEANLCLSHPSFPRRARSPQALPDADWWTWVWTSHATVEDVWQCLPTPSLRNLRQTNPAKLAIFIQKVRVFTVRAAGGTPDVA
jgi:hypothetical protein